MIGRRSVPAATMPPLLSALLRGGRAMPTMAEHLSGDVQPCMVLICQQGNRTAAAPHAAPEQQQQHSKP